MNKLTGILTVIIFFSFHLFSFGQVITLKDKISIQLKNTTAAQVIEELDRQSNYTFSYTREQLEKIAIKSFVFDNTSLGVALDNLQRLANLEFNLLGNTIAVKVNAKSATVPVQASQGKPGKLIGVVRNEKNEVMPGVTIIVDATNNSTTSSINGDYALTLPPGTYTLLFSFVGYQSKKITDAVVNEDEMTDLSVVLTAASKQMQAVVVTSGARRESTRSLLLAQKNNASMTNGISAEQIRVTPDNNTAQVLKRVSGITVQGEKFVTIRGVSDRYNNVLINGATLPSTEPNRRNFSFDIVPSALVDNIVVNKTATPDLPGEFTGGLIQINTKDVPVENFLNLTVGTGFNSASVAKEFIGFKRDKKAYLANVDGDRKWFGDGRIFQQQEYVKYYGSNDTAAMRKIGAQIPIRWQAYRYNYTPQQNYQLAGGVNKHLKNNSVIGAIAAVTYLNEQFYEEGEARSLQNFDVSSDRYRFNTTIGGLLNIAYKSKRHKLAWKNLYNNRYSNQYDERYGYQFNSGRGIENRTGEVTLTNRLLHTRLEGDHNLIKGIKLDWYGDYITLRREQPDGRFLVAEEQDSLGKHVYGYDFNTRLLLYGGLYSSLLDEKRKNTGGNLNIPFNLAKEKQNFKIGYSWSKREADYDATGLRILNPNGSDYAQSKKGLPYYEVINRNAITSGQLVYTPTYVRSETTGDQYTASQKLQASYAMLDLKLLKQLRLVGGMRYENNKMTVSTVFYDVLTGYPVFKDSSYYEKDWLPSANLIYSVTDKFNIRGAFSKTLARPDFVERSPYVYYDFMEQVQVTGQQSLEVSRIKNYDLRFEYYPSGNEIISASVFYKDFSNPVERFYNLGNPSNSVEYRNLYSATAKGYEIDIRKSLGFIDPGTPWLQNLYISSNYTYLKGEINYAVTSSPFTLKDTFYVEKGKRPIQGLSPYIINAGLNYQNKTWGFNIAYNRFGRRIVNGGTNPLLIQYENSRDVVDLQLSTRVLNQKAELKLNVSDLLNQYIIIYCNNVNRNPDGSRNPGLGGNDDPKGEAFNEALDLIIYKAKKGTNFSVSLSFKF
ncbi:MULTISPECIES: TonB-dependent receptor [Niastella]|uniref:TonB-dependent receptor n=1 Tax=Niastella soli TaxID=2821487 RepID=A0ABS3Z5Z5_9BACT|nr:TonB-dependent receptor [Niastella soli]MBO9205182.1 TonB-dependent receptor [Niastella soli]